MSIESKIQKLIDQIDSALGSGQLSKNDEVLIYQKARKLQLSREVVENLIVDRSVIWNRSQIQGPSEKKVSKLELRDLVKGQHIRIEMHDESTGPSTDEYIYLEGKWFFLLKHEASILRETDCLIALNSPWNINYSVDFYVFRNKKQLKGARGESIYRTKKISAIVMLSYCATT